MKKKMKFRKRTLLIGLLALALAAVLTGCDDGGIKVPGPAQGETESAVTGEGGETEVIKDSSGLLKLTDATMENVTYKVPVGWKMSKQENGSLLYGTNDKEDSFSVSYNKIDPSKTSVEKMIDNAKKNTKKNSYYYVTDGKASGYDCTKLQFKSSGYYHFSYIIPLDEKNIFVLDFLSSTQESKYADTFSYIADHLKVEGSTGETETNS